MNADRKFLVQELIKTRFAGNQAAFARAIKKSPNQVNQWLTGYRSVGDGAARNIEIMLGLGNLWMDGKELGAPPAPTLQLVRDPVLDNLDVLEPHEAERWRIRIQAAADERRLDLRAAQEARRKPEDRESNHDPTIDKCRASR